MISGNVSLYNETRGEGIYPTPVIGALGLLEDSTRHVSIGFGSPGDVVMLLGAPVVHGEAGSLSGSEYLERVHGLVVGRPTIDLVLEAAVQRACRRLVREGRIKSAHDLSDGGLAVAVAESCIDGNLGFLGELAISGRWDAALFGEHQSRVAVSASADLLPDVQRVCEEEGVPYVRLGTCGGGSLVIDGIIDLPVSELGDIWRNALERAVRVPSASRLDTG